jgi:hypothetical protein
MVGKLIDDLLGTNQEEQHEKAYGDGVKDAQNEGWLDKAAHGIGDIAVPPEVGSSQSQSYEAGYHSGKTSEENVIPDISPTDSSPSRPSGKYDDVLLIAVLAMLIVITGIVLAFVRMNSELTEGTPNQRKTASTAGVGVVREVNAANVNIRSGPGINYAVVSVIPKGSRLIEIKGVSQQSADASTWIKVTTPNQEYEGWVNQKFIR